MQAKLEGQLSMHQDESKRRQQHLQTELNGIIKRQKQLEARNLQLQRQGIDSRNAIKDVELSEEQYTELKTRNEEELSLHDLVAVSFCLFVYLFFNVLCLITINTKSRVFIFYVKTLLWCRSELELSNFLIRMLGFPLV